MRRFSMGAPWVGSSAAGAALKLWQNPIVKALKEQDGAYDSLTHDYTSGQASSWSNLLCVSLC